MFDKLRGLTPEEKAAMEREEEIEKEKEQQQLMEADRLDKMQRFAIKELTERLNITSDDIDNLIPLFRYSSLANVYMDKNTGVCYIGREDNYSTSPKVSFCPLYDADGKVIIIPLEEFERTYQYSPE